MILKRSSGMKLSVLMAMAVLTGCGGGGDGTPAQTGPTAEGVYGGTISGGTAKNAFRAVVLENGDLWTLYGTSTAGTLAVAGLVQGSGSSTNGSYTTSNAKDFGFSPALSASITATYTSVPTISGSLTVGNTNATFSGGAIPGSTYTYNTPAVLSDVVGSWTLTSTDGTTGISLVIASDGTFTASPPAPTACVITGTVLPRPSGKNVFNTTSTFGAGCGGQTSTTGIGVVYPLSGGGSQVVFADINASRTAGDVSFGSR